MLKDIVRECRSYRRFYETEVISERLMEELVDLARHAGTTSNSQALKYRIVCKEDEKQKTFDALSWAGALKDWDGPEPGERPSGYIVILCDKLLGTNKQWDEGIAAQTIMLGAVEAGFGGCMLGTVKRSQLAEDLGIDAAQFNIGLVLALGKPKEEVVLVSVPEDGNVTYYRDENQIHYVPKRSLADILVKPSKLVYNHKYGSQG